MRYFVKLNEQLNSMAEIRNFNERVRGSQDRELDIFAKIENAQEREQLISNLTPFMGKDSVTKIEIITEEQKVIFSTSAYNKIDSFQVEFTPDDNVDLNEDENEVVSRITFRISAEEEDLVE